MPHFGPVSIHRGFPQFLFDQGRCGQLLLSICFIIRRLLELTGSKIQSKNKIIKSMANVVIPTAPKQIWLGDQNHQNNQILFWDSPQNQIEQSLCGFFDLGLCGLASLWTTHEIMGLSCSKATLYKIYISPMCTTTDVSLWPGIRGSFGRICGSANSQQHSPSHSTDSAALL